MAEKNPEERWLRWHYTGDIKNSPFKPAARFFMHIDPASGDSKTVIGVAEMPPKDSLSALLEYEGRRKLEEMQDYNPETILKKGSFVFMDTPGSEKADEEIKVSRDRFAELERTEEKYRNCVPLSREDFRALKAIELGSREISEAYEKGTLSATDTADALARLHARIQDSVLGNTEALRRRKHELRGKSLLADVLPYLTRRKSADERHYASEGLIYPKEAGACEIIAAIESLKTALVVELRDLKDLMG